MELPEEIKRIRQRSLLTQIDFAKEVKVAFSTVNRWECGKAKPNINAMKSIKEFCLNHDIDYTTIKIAMPYLSGADLCALSTLFGFPVTYSWNTQPRV